MENHAALLPMSVCECSVETDLVLVPALLDVLITDPDPRFNECLYQIWSLYAQQVSHLLRLCVRENLLNTRQNIATVV